MLIFSTRRVVQTNAERCIYGNIHTSDRWSVWSVWSIPTSWSRSFREKQISDLYDLYDLAHVAGWEPNILHDRGYFSGVGSVLCRSCTTSHNGRLGSRLSRSWSICARCGKVSSILFKATIFVVCAVLSHPLRCRKNALGKSSVPRALVCCAYHQCINI